MRPAPEGGGQEPALENMARSTRGSRRTCAVPGAQVLGLRQPAAGLRSLQRSRESLWYCLRLFASVAAPETCDDAVLSEYLILCPGSVCCGFIKLSTPWSRASRLAGRAAEHFLARALYRTGW